MTRRHDEDLLDAALADSFTASDPPSMSIPAPPTPGLDLPETQQDETAAMVTLLYRVVAAKEGAHAFEAHPPYHAGRWTSKGTPALYVSLSAGTALLEKLVHLEEDGSNLVLAIGSMPTAALTAKVSLPPEWNLLPYRSGVQCTGDAWLREHRYLGIRVPSAVVHAESNVILDVEHPEFARIKLLETQPLTLDRRLRGD